MEMVYWVYFTINSSNQSILPLQLIAIVRVCKKKNMADYLPKSSPATQIWVNNRHVFLLIADGCAHIIRSLDARFQVITEDIISFFSPIQHIWANEGLCLPLQTHCFSANAVPEAFASRPRNVRVTSQRRSRHVPEAIASRPRGDCVCSQIHRQTQGLCCRDAVFLSGQKKSPKRRSALGYLFSLVYKEALITSLG